MGFSYYVFIFLKIRFNVVFINLFCSIKHSLDCYGFICIRNKFIIKFFFINFLFKICGEDFK